MSGRVSLSFLTCYFSQPDTWISFTGTNNYVLSVNLGRLNLGMDLTGSPGVRWLLLLIPGKAAFCILHLSALSTEEMFSGDL